MDSNLKQILFIFILPTLFKLFIVWFFFCFEIIFYKFYHLLINLVTSLALQHFKSIKAISSLEEVLGLEEVLLMGLAFHRGGDYFQVDDDR